MGYTHYYGRKRGISQSDPRWKDVIADARQIIGGCEVRLSGDDDLFMAPPVVSEEEVLINGYGVENRLDGFTLPLDDTFDGDTEEWSFGFCKTNRNPYDQVVAALLIAVKHHFGSDVYIGSDGSIDLEWKDGAWEGVGSPIDLYTRIFPTRKVPEDLLG